MGAGAERGRVSLAAEQWRLLARRDLSSVAKPWCLPCACVLPGELHRTKTHAVLEAGTRILRAMGSPPGLFI